MTYTKLTELQHKIIAPVLARLTETLEGYAITVRDTPKELSIVRTLLYSYWHFDGTKKHYKITQESPTTFRIVKRAMPQPRTPVEQAPPSPVEEFVLDHLQDEVDPEVVAGRLRDTFGPKDVLEGVKLWRRLNDLE